MEVFHDRALWGLRSNIYFVVVLPNRRAGTVHKLAPRGLTLAPWASDIGHNSAVTYSNVSKHLRA
jgi:hypothetical protein